MTQLTYAEGLIQQYASLFKEATSHSLTTELCKGTLSDARLLVYLIQDLLYFNVGLRLFGRALTLCDDVSASIVIAKQIGFVSNAENDYFYKAIEELSTSFSPEQVRQMEQTILPAVEMYIAYMEDLTHNPSITYAQVITSLFVMERVYLEWADNAITDQIIPTKLAFKYNEWIVLHSGEAFTQFVKFLESEVNRCGDSAASRNSFLATLEYEVGFFDECYDQELLK
ncbi:hypothetical protein BABINDRAFT_5696 [Babjeviella inositovora NRRL Y-12698]|uniref:Thiaminase-2/PQQC domain-containing protein n=1 Tax=Babjeviella inositovora NRRL Y-12698 TaxID=984486 RepID=A0A1E3QYN9_9ASCO|nr:uncharacterized protein BABINDRAFT_5696 [Babjeviella inositovora NRRL Y-12698]ODQ82783.1 hypothetical protein BABINDRAFT_5696 [Babjeviella inositovora NRRL Y-12698]